MATSVPAAKQALQAALRARLGTTALIHVGLPAKVPRQKDRVYLSGTEGLERERIVQQRLRRETYLLPVIIEVERAGGAQAIRDSCEQRAWDILDELEAALDDDPEFGGILNDSEVESVPSEVTLPLQSNDGWLTRITVQIRMLALVG